MAKQLDEQDNRAWIESVGGLTAATLLVAEALKCGISKAEKVATGRYPSKLPAHQVKALDALKKRRGGKRRLSDHKRKADAS